MTDQEEQLKMQTKYIMDAATALWGKLKSIENLEREIANYGLFNLPETRAKHIAFRKLHLNEWRRDVAMLHKGLRIETSNLSAIPPELVLEEIPQTDGLFFTALNPDDYKS